jgi:hypothetical protein
VAPTQKKRIDKICIVSGKPFQAARKEGNQKYKERYWEVV